MPKRKLSSEEQKHIEEQPFILGLSISKHRASSENSSLDESYTDNSECWILRLPSEIIEHIFSFLCPRTLLSVANLNCRRITDSALQLNMADFTLCNNILPAEIGQFFVRDRCRYIREINFSFVFLVKASELEKAIAKCKHLTTLSVIKCGLKLANIHRILCQCVQLQELYWDVCVCAPTKFTELQTSPLQIKKLYLYLSAPHFLDVAFYILKRCQSATEICFNFSSYISPTYPLKTSKRNIAYKLHLNSSCPVNIVLNDWYKYQATISEYIETKVKCSCSNSGSRKSEMEICSISRTSVSTCSLEGTLSLTMTSPYLQLVTRAEDFVLLKNIPSESVQKLVLYCTNKKFLVQNVDAVKRVAGHNLKYFSLKEMTLLTQPCSFTEVDVEAESLSIYEVLPNLIYGCLHIQDLILSDVHFEEPLDFKMLNCLNELKTLALPSCVFHPDKSRTSVKKNSSQQKSFEELTKSCQDIQQFAIIGCEVCDLGPNDKDLFSIQEWTKLQALSLVKIKTLQFCHFLRSLPKGCPSLRSLELLDVGSSLVCQYLPSVMFLLSDSPQLKLLCTNLDSLCIRSVRFWNAVSLAKNLQGLCFTIIASIEIYAKPIVDAVEKLQLLHLFHLNSPNPNDTLRTRLIRIMKRHGVKNPEVEISPVYDDEHRASFCDKPHFYTL